MTRTLDERCALENYHGITVATDVPGQETILRMKFDSEEMEYPVKLTVRSNAFYMPQNYTKRECNLLFLCVLAYPDFFRSGGVDDG